MKPFNEAMQEAAEKEMGIQFGERLRFFMRGTELAKQYFEAQAKEFNLRQDLWHKENQKLEAELSLAKKDRDDWENKLGIAYENLNVAENELEQIKSYLPKVPTQPYEKEMAQEIKRLKAELADYKIGAEVEGRAADAARAELAQVKENIKKLSGYNVELINRGEQITSLKLDLQKHKEALRVAREALGNISVAHGIACTTNECYEFCNLKLKSEAIAKIDEVLK